MKRMPDSAVEQARKLIFEDGLRCNEAAKIVGYNAALISNRLKAIGFHIPRNNSGRTKIDFPIDDAVDMYISGVSEQAIAKKFGVSRHLVRDRLVSSGVAIRGKSEAGVVSAARATPEQRKLRTMAANEKVRGVKQPKEMRIKRANTLENNPYEHMVGFGEIEFKDALEASNISFTWQKAFHIYSLDFLIGNVALELKKNAWDRGRSDIKNGRIKYLKDNGISTIYLVYDSIKSMLDSFEYIINVVNETNDSPLSCGEYLVISCREKDNEVIRNNLGQFESIQTKPRLINKTIKRNY